MGIVELTPHTPDCEKIAIDEMRSGDHQSEAAARTTTDRFAIAAKGENGNQLPSLSPVTGTR